MSLELIIRDPHTLTKAEKAAICAFAQIEGFIVDALSPPQVAVMQVENSPAVYDPQAAVLESMAAIVTPPLPVISHDDRPDVGAAPEPLPLVAIPSPPSIAQQFDAAAIFGAAEPAAALPAAPPPAPTVVEELVQPVVQWPTFTAPAAAVEPETAADAPSVPLPPSQPLPEGSQALQVMFGMSVPSPAVAPVAPIADTSPSVAPAPLVDVQGLPWDHRIHASTKGRNQDGRWKKRKNTEPALVDQVEAELRQALSAPGAPVPVPAPPVVIPSAPAAVTTAPAAPATVPALFAWASAQIAAGRFTQPGVFEAVQSVGLPNMIALNTRPDLVGAVYAALLAKAGL